MTSDRLKRPALERERPIRTWSTLFGPPNAGAGPTGAPPERDGRAGMPHGAPPPAGVDPSGRVLADAVEAGYRVINEYMREGQAAAEAFSPGTWTRPTAAAGVPADMPQLAQRVMQYGWDFAGLWFELWTRMGGAATGWPSPIGAPVPRADAWAPPVEPSTPRSAPPPSEQAPVRLSVSVVSDRRTAATLDFRPGSAGPFVVHALRAEGHESAPIADVTIECGEHGAAILVRVVVGAAQPPGMYNGLVIDAATNLPRGSVSVRVFAETEP